MIDCLTKDMAACMYSAYAKVVPADLPSHRVLSGSKVPSQRCFCWSTQPDGYFLEHSDASAGGGASVVIVVLWVGDGVGGGVGDGVGGGLNGGGGVGWRHVGQLTLPAQHLT